MMQDQPSELTWREGGVPVSGRFDDPYYSLENGLGETRHVFLAANDLPARFRVGFHVAELGFGTGLNALVTALAATHPIRFTSFEAYPLSTDEMARALAAFPELDPVAGPLLAQWAEGRRKIDLPNMQLRIIEGDARTELARWGGQADAWYLDGFSPAKNPELWGLDLMRAVYAHTAQHGTFATYTAAGHVRRALGDAGFEVQRVPGYGRKRHMSAGRK